MNNRVILILGSLLLGLVIFFTQTNVLQAIGENEDVTAGQQALQKLREGNNRFITDKMIRCDKSNELRQALVTEQFPFATILCCSDSRVSPEIIFDQGLGDLFIVRVAGNVPGDTELESIEYATQVLKSSLIVVLGHENCGAIKAALSHQIDGIPVIAALLEPAIKRAEAQEGNALVNTIKTNAQVGVEKIKKNPHFKTLIDQKKLKVVGGYYNFQSGVVDFFED